MSNVLQRMRKTSVEAKSAAVYTMSTLLSRGLALITTPIFTRIMTTSEIGTVTLFNSWYGIVSSVATLALTSGGYSLALKEFSDEKDQYVSSVLSLTSLISLVLAGLFYFFRDSLLNFVGLPQELIVLMFIGCVVAPARDFWLARERFEFRYKGSGLLILLSATGASLLSVIAVLYGNSVNSAKVAELRLYANYAIVFGVSAFLWISLLNKGRCFYSRKYWKVSLSLSLPLVGYQVASQILSMSDRVMIDKFIGKDAVGIYGTLFTISSLSILLWNALNTSFVPYLFQNIDKRENKIQSISFDLLGFYSAIAIILTLFAPEILKVIAPEEYYGAVNIMPPIAAGIYLTAVAHMYSNILVYFKQTKYVMYAAVIAAVLNVGLNYIYIPLYGYQAAAYTTLFAHIVMAALEMLWARRISRKEGFQEVYMDKAIVAMSIITVAVTLLSIISYTRVVVRGGMIVGVLLTIVGFARKKVLEQSKHR